MTLNAEIRNWGRYSEDDKKRSYLWIQTFAFCLPVRQINTAKGSKQRFSSVIPGQLGKAFKKRTLETLGLMHNADFVPCTLARQLWLELLKYKITTEILWVTLATEINIQFILHWKIPAGWVVSMATTGVLVQECLTLTDTTVKVYITYSSKPDTTKAVADPSYRTLFCDSSSVLGRMESLYCTRPFGWRGSTHLTLTAVEFTLFAVKFRGGEGSVNKRIIGCK